MDSLNVWKKKIQSLINEFPQYKGVTFGYELECITTKLAGKDLLAGNHEHGKPVDGFTMWRAETDGSIRKDGITPDVDNPRGYLNPVEFTTIPIRLDELDAFEQEFNRLVQTFGLKTNYSCGGHIHIGVDKFFPELLGQGVKSQLRRLELVAYWQLVEYGAFMINPERWKLYSGNDYCQLWNDRRFGALSSEGIVDSRYFALNFCSLSEHTTLEFRVFDAAIDFTHFLRNLYFALKFLHECKQGTITNYHIERFSAQEFQELSRFLGIRVNPQDVRFKSMYSASIQRKDNSQLSVMKLDEGGKRKVSASELPNEKRSFDNSNVHRYQENALNRYLRDNRNRTFTSALLAAKISILSQYTRVVMVSVGEARKLDGLIKSEERMVKDQSGKLVKRPVKVTKSTEVVEHWTLHMYEEVGQRFRRYIRQEQEIIRRANARTAD